MSKIKWAYGVTTVHSRAYDLLPRTVESLGNAGFETPWLFADDTANRQLYLERIGEYNQTLRYPAIRTAGNWVLSLAEIYLRDPIATYYAIFQDDLIAVKGLREYIERTVFLGEKRYYNLHTFPRDEALPSFGEPQWCEGPELSNGQHPLNYQQGRGAVALVFPREAVITLLSSRHIWERFGDTHTGWRNIDGGIVTAMNQAGWREWVHYPSLVKHTGVESTTRQDRRYARMESYHFPGEEFDATSWLPKLQDSVILSNTL